jgi:hypothetical protein
MEKIKNSYFENGGGAKNLKKGRNSHIDFDIKNRTANPY